MWSFGVPNVPCGVESILTVINIPKKFPVPNVPCGVERYTLVRISHRIHLFLMYRVELKANQTETLSKV